ncbi:hypothetical protein [Paracoccus beibuensis]|uniref:hypothetical protein n=1 Tax=Paracoccus beibuensis TaxID=547602 RepID=UPI002240356E|nr:hypothetical protein [Paracoccus beibuensis]
MLRLGVAIGPRRVHASQPRPVPEILLSLSAGNADVPAQVDALTLTIEAGPYAGTYPVTRASLAQGPLCLVPATLSPAPAGQPLTAVPGLWVYDANLGPVETSRQWLADGAVLADQAGLQLEFSAQLQGRTIAHVETARQAAVEAVHQTPAVVWPPQEPDTGESDPEPEPEAPEEPVFKPEWVILSDQRISLSNVTTSSGTVSFSIDASSAYQGSFIIHAADLAQGPVCLVPPAVAGTTEDGASLTATPGLWVSLSEQITCTGEWLHDGQATGGAGTAHVIRIAQDGGASLSYRETATDTAGSRQALSAVVAVPAAPAVVVPPSDGWTALEWRNATGGYAGQATRGADGSITVTSASGNRAGNPRVHFDVTPGETYQLETVVEYGNATRIIGRLSDATGNNSGLDVAVFDVSRPADQTRLVRSDTFTPTTGCIAMHYVFVMGLAGQARILPETRVKKVS